MTPFELEILMHHYVSPAEFPRPSDSYEDIITDFITAGVMDATKTVTDMGDAWIQCILNTPFPKTKTVFIDANGKIIKEEL
jgi:hypothetical protein